MGAGSGGGPVSASGGHSGSGGVAATGGIVGSGGTPGASGGSPGAAGGSGSGGLSGSGGTGHGGATPHANTGGSAGSGTTSLGGKGGGINGGGGAKGAPGGAGGHAGIPGGTGGSGTGGSAGAGGSGSLSTATLLVNLANAFCTAARTCCAPTTYPTMLDDCEAKFQSRLPDLANVANGTETIDDTALSACIAGYQATATTCAFQPLEAACKGVFLGTKSAGAACGKGGVPNVGGAGECKVTDRATVCLWTGDANDPTTTGTCLTPAHGKQGDPCAVSCAKNDVCIFDLYTSPGYPTAGCFEDDGLYCASVGNSSVCTPIAATGASCADDLLSCASTDYCDSSSGTSKCRTGATLGQACSTSGPDCVQGMSLFCSSANRCEDLGFAFDLTCGGTPPFPL